MKTEKTIAFWAEALFLSQKSKSEKERKETIERLIKILRKNKKEHLAGRILKKLEKIVQRESRVELVFARDHRPEFVEQVKKRLLKVFGQDKQINMKIDGKIIGGFQVKTGSLLIRASLKDFLTDLAGSLK